MPRSRSPLETAANGTIGNEPAKPVRRFPDELLEEARDVFQKRTERPLTKEDARQMLENLVGFFRTLQSWDRQHRLEAGDNKPPKADD